VATTKYWFKDNKRLNLGLDWAVSANVTNPNFSIEGVASNPTFSGVTALPPQLSLPTTTTAPSAGGGGALPATPAGYMTVKLNGTDRKIPYY
jgi:hypothetical protein